MRNHRHGGHEVAAPGGAASIPASIGRTLEAGASAAANAARGSPKYAIKWFSLTGMFVAALGFIYLGWLAPGQKEARADSDTSPFHVPPSADAIQGIVDRAISPLRDDLKGLKDELRDQRQRIDRVLEAVAAKR